MAAELIRDFEANRKFWLENPLAEKWEGRKISDTLQQVAGLLQEWHDRPISPFSPDVDAAVLETAATLRQAGAVWFTNGILPPDAEPGNWPFHLKALERQAVAAKAARVGLSSKAEEGVAAAEGYVCGAGEAHQFCVRAAVQEIRRAAPGAHVTVVAGDCAHAGVQGAAEMLGLPLARVQCGRMGEMALADLDRVLGALSGAVVVAATWRSAHGGGYDDIGAIAERLRAREARTGLPALLHLDAARSFDDATTLSAAERARLGMPRLRLGGGRRGSGGGVGVATVVAGGAVGELVVALKPRGFGAGRGGFVEYVAGCDDTVSGSRDALGGALVALHEARFGAAGLRRAHQHCRLIRDALASRMAAAGVPLRLDGRGLDLVVEPGPWLSDALFGRWGARRLADGAAMLAVQPSATLASACRLLGDVVPGRAKARKARELRLRGFAVPRAMTEQLRHTAAQWRVQSARSCGYPGNHSTLSVIGPIVGHVLAAPVAATWVQARARELLAGTCAALGVDAACVAAAFTRGSTAGNRIALLTAWSALPHATLYYSTAAHYSIAKIAADHDRLRSAAVAVPADALGRMAPALFARRLARDKRTAAAAGRPFAALLLATCGTTFSGATDDLLALHAAAAREGCRIDYVHLDGALELGASMSRFTLGPPGSAPAEPASGRLVVQSVSVSHHKFPGLSVAGQVVCWAPPCGRLVSHDGSVDSRAVFELWLYRQLVSHDDADALYRHCLENARRLRWRLQEAGIPLLFNPESIVTLVQRQPPWLVNRFNLAPERDWVHFIAMPHVSAAVVDEFAGAVAEHGAAVRRALSPVRRRISQLYALPDSDMRLRRLDGEDKSLMAHVASALYAANPSEAAVDAERVRSEWVTGALCFTAASPSGKLLAVLLVRVTEDQNAAACAVLLSSSGFRRGCLQVSDAETLASVLIHSLFCNRVICTPKLDMKNITAAILPDINPARRPAHDSVGHDCLVSAGFECAIEQEVF